MASLEVRALASERLTTFVDAVIAIAITLLALDLPMPAGATNAAILHSVADHGEEYIAFLFSFAVVGSYWRMHHQVFRYVTALSSRITVLTLPWLLMQVILPFATRMLYGDGGFQVRFIFYALVQVAAEILFILMIKDVRREHVYRDAMPPTLLADSIRHSAVLAGTFALSIPLCLLGNPWIAFGCWIIVPRVVRAAQRSARRGSRVRAR